MKFFQQDGQTPLGQACAQGLTDVVAELVRRHAYVNTVDKVNIYILFKSFELYFCLFRMVIPFFSLLLKVEKKIV